MIEYHHPTLICVSIVCCNDSIFNLSCCRVNGLVVLCVADTLRLIFGHSDTSSLPRQASVYVFSASLECLRDVLVCGIACTDESPALFALLVSASVDDSSFALKSVNFRFTNFSAEVRYCSSAVASMHEGGVLSSSYCTPSSLDVLILSVNDDELYNGDVRLICE